MVSADATGVPRVSIVLPVYNGARFLRLSVDSMLAQTFGDFELLLLDDGSSDDSLAIARECEAADARVRVHALPHRGLAATLNEGLRLAQAPLVARMDGDDVAWPERLALQVAFLDRFPAIGAVGGQVRGIDSNGGVSSNMDYPCAPEDVKAQLFARCPLVHPTVVMRRQPVIDIGGYRPMFTYAEDYDLWLRLDEHVALANLPDVVLDFRRHPGNVSQRFQLQQALDGLAARASALARRATGRDPLAHFAGRFDIATLDAIDLTAALRSEWLATSFMAIAHYGIGADPTLRAWVEAASYAALARHRSEAICETMTRAHFAIARNEWLAGNHRAALEHLRRALAVAPRTAIRRAVGYAWKRVRSAVDPAINRT